MVYAQRVLLGGDVVPQHQIQLVVHAPAAGNGGDGVVGFTMGLREDKGILIGIATPCGQYPVRQLHQLILVRAVQPDNAHGPLDNSRFYILVAPEGDFLFHRCLLHGEAVAPSLKVLMAQNAATHDGQVSVTADEVAGEDRDEIQQLGKCRPVNLHGDVPGIESNAVLVVVHIGAVL